MGEKYFTGTVRWWYTFKTTSFKVGKINLTNAMLVLEGGGSPRIANGTHL